MNAPASTFQILREITFSAFAFMCLAMGVTDRIEGDWPGWMPWVLLGVFVGLLALLVVATIGSWGRPRFDGKLSGRARWLYAAGVFPALAYWLYCMVTGNGSTVLMWVLAIAAVASTAVSSTMASRSSAAQPGTASPAA